MNDQFNVISRDTIVHTFLNEVQAGLILLWAYIPEKVTQIKNHTT
jgi:hypothetical protein